MRILALDSSGLVAGVAIVERNDKEEVLLSEYTLNYKKTHSQTLLPMLDEMTRMTGIDLSGIDAIAVAGGPGSFTGLRIGVATAKGLGLALEKPLIAIPTLEGLAYNMWGTERLICPIMDARRGQVYTGLYEMDGDHLKVIEDQMAVPIETIADKIRAIGRPAVFLGDGVPVFKEVLETNPGRGQSIFFAPAAMNRQRAVSVASLAFIYWDEGRTVDASSYAPQYLRVSQAEREKMEKESGL